MPSIEEEEMNDDVDEKEDVQVDGKVVDTVNEELYKVFSIGDTSIFPIVGRIQLVSRRPTVKVTRGVLCNWKV